jgi:hypothetical protein
VERISSRVGGGGRSEVGGAVSLIASVTIFLTSASVN